MDNINNSLSVKTIYKKLSDFVDFGKCNESRLAEGIQDFARDRGYESAAEKVSLRTLEKLISDELSSLFKQYGSKIVLYFENYALVEHFRLSGNKIRSLSNKKLQGYKVEYNQVSECREVYDKYIGEISAIDGLRDLLSFQISESMADMNYLLDKTVNTSVGTGTESRRIADGKNQDI